VCGKAAGYGIRKYIKAGGWLRKKEVGKKRITASSESEKEEEEVKCECLRYWS
jgi:hypothetical protein